MEESYKVDLLKNLEPHAELLVYDWSNGGDIELVVEDIEKIGKKKQNSHAISIASSIIFAGGFKFLMIFNLFIAKIIST